MRRFYLPPQNIRDSLAVFSGSEARHIRSALRLRTGTDIEIFDGSGQLYHAVIEEISSRKISARIVGEISSTPDHNVQLTLAMGVLKGKKMDLVIQKATELGVHTLQPLITRYCERRETDSRSQTQRRHRIILEACKQCGRVRPMHISPPVELTAFSPPGDALAIMPFEQEKSDPFPSKLPRGVKKACLLIGPEGGFHPDEVALAKEKGFQTVSLGPLILRAETAAISATALTMHLLGAFTPRPANKC